MQRKSRGLKANPWESIDIVQTWKKQKILKKAEKKYGGEVKPFKYFIHNMWEGFLVYESDNLCSYAVSRHVTWAVSFNITAFLFSPTQVEAMAPAAWLLSLYQIR